MIVLPPSEMNYSFSILFTLISQRNFVMIIQLSRGKSESRESMNGLFNQKIREAKPKLKYVYLKARSVAADIDNKSKTADWITNTVHAQPATVGT